MRYKLLIGQKRTYIYKWGKIKYILKSNINNIFLRISGRGDIWVKFLRKNISFFFFLNELYFLFYLFFIFLFFKFIYFNWRLITLQYSIGFAIHWHESSMGVHVFPILNPHSHLPPHPIPLGHSSAPAPSTLYHASNLDWQFISYVIIYMFQCHSPKSSHPHPLPQSPKDCSIHLCLLLSRMQGYLYHLSKVHIYELVYCIGAFLSGLLHSV